MLTNGRWDVNSPQYSGSGRGYIVCNGDCRLVVNVSLESGIGKYTSVGMFGVPLGDYTYVGVYRVKSASLPSCVNFWVTILEGGNNDAT